jgi:hypothetical protein
MQNIDRETSGQQTRSWEDGGLLFCDSRMVIEMCLCALLPLCHVKGIGWLSI